LETPHDPCLDPLDIAQTDNIAPFQSYPTTLRTQPATDKIDQARFSRPVWPDQRDAIATLDAELNAVGHPDAAESVAQAVDFK
jgi:hypothetical protein